MSTPIWQQLISLVNLDQQCQAIKKSIDGVTLEIDTHRNEIRVFETEITQYSAKVLAEQKAVRDIEHGLKELAARQSQVKNTLENSRTHKEIQSAERELASLSLRYAQLEDGLIRAWHELEGTQKKLTDITAAHEKLISNEEQAITALQEKIKELEMQNTALEDAQEEKIRLLPAEWQTRYRQLKGKVANPIVPLLHQSCSVCYYHVLPQDFARIKRNAVVQCQNCYRYLYYDKATEVANDTASY